MPTRPAPICYVVVALDADGMVRLYPHGDRTQLADVLRKLAYLIIEEPGTIPHMTGECSL